jgi:glycosyltransferase involved in cell wall biosynthesis
MRAIGGQSLQANLVINGLRACSALRVSFQAIDPRLPPPLRALQEIKYVRTAVTFPWYCIQLVVSILRCDVVHVFSASYFSFVLATTPAIALGRLFRKKVVVNYHSGEAADHLRRWPSAVRMLRFAHEIVVPSPFLVRVFGEFGLAARSIFNAVDLEKFKYRAREIARPTFLANRNFEAHYNVSNVLRAFAVIQRNNPDASLTIVGAGPQVTLLQNLASQLGLRNTSFVGRVSSDEMATFYDRHDIWLNASDVDNMPLSILEAFSSGVAVVSTSAGGIPDLVEHMHTGLLCDCGDPPALARNAESLLNSADLFQRLTKNAREECAKYSWEAVGRQWEALYVGLGSGASGER